MSLQDSLLRNRVFRYLGCNAGSIDTVTDRAVTAAIADMTKLANFKFRICSIADLDEQPAFLKKENYNIIRSYIPEALLFAGTLGMCVDRKIRSLLPVNLSEAVILNAAANAFLDKKVEDCLASDQTLFCPGYSGTDQSDILPILDIVEAKKYAGIFTSESGVMIPEKSMTGLILHNYTFTCRGCIIKSKCEYLKQNKTCYGNQ